MTRWILAGLLGLCFQCAMAAGDRLDISMSFPWTDEQGDADPVFQKQYAIAQQVTKVTGVESTITTTHDMGREMQRSRTGQTPILLAPAHVISSGLKNGYELLGVVRGESEVAVLVAAPGFKSLSDLKGRRLLLPGQDGLVTYLILGEFQSRGIDPKKFFSEISYVRFPQAALHGLDIGAADVVGTSADIFRSWHPAGGSEPNVILRSQSVPARAMAVRSDVPARLKDALRRGFLQPDRNSPLAEAGGSDMLVPGDKSPFSYLASLGHHTPVAVNGAKVVTANEVRTLMAKGALLFDTRIPVEYEDGHIVGARPLPYGENSLKEVDFDAALDQFDIGALPQDKNQTIIFQCNGPECWKSYKASVRAIRAGYKNVYWFRGGYPEWKVAGYPLEQGRAERTALR